MNKTQFCLTSGRVTVGLTTPVAMLFTNHLFRVTDLEIKTKVVFKVRIHGQLELSPAFPHKTSSVRKLNRMKQNVPQSVTFDLPIEAEKSC